MVPRRVSAHSAPVPPRRRSQHGTQGRGTSDIRALVSQQDIVPCITPCGAQLGPRSPSHAAPANAYPTPMVRQPTHSRVTTYPSTRVSFRKKTRPAADYTPNLGLVQAHCIADGGDPATINLLHIPFADGISTEALTRRMTRDEARKYNQGASGQAFRMFLHADEENRFHCRLCAVGTDEEGWKQARDALRHLKREYFGLGFRCNRWSVLEHLYQMNYRLTCRTHQR